MLAGKMPARTGGIPRERNAAFLAAIFETEAETGKSALLPFLPLHGKPRKSFIFRKNSSSPFLCASALRTPKFSARPIYFFPPRLYRLRGKTPLWLRLRRAMSQRENPPSVAPPSRYETRAGWQSPCSEEKIKGLPEPDLPYFM
jgi:hypothetical protein